MNRNSTFQLRTKPTITSAQCRAAIKRYLNQTGKCFPAAAAKVHPSTRVLPCTKDKFLDVCEMKGARLVYRLGVVLAQLQDRVVAMQLNGESDNPRYFVDRASLAA